MTYEKIKEYLETHAVNCKTEEEAREFLGFLHEKGFEWSTGEAVLSKTYWSRYEEMTAYSWYLGFGYSDVDWHKENGYTLVAFKQFKEEFMKRKFKPGDKVRLRDDLMVYEMNEIPLMNKDMWEIARDKQTLMVEVVLGDAIWIKEDKKNLSWGSSWFELVEPAEEYKEYTVEELEKKIGHKIKIRGDE